MNPSYTRFARVALAVVTAAVGGVTLAQTASVAPPHVDHHSQYGVGDYQALIPARAVEFKSYRTIVLTNPSYSDDEKAAKIAQKFSAIGAEVRAERIAAYSAVSRSVGVGNSCTKGSSGGSPKKCDAKCAGAPLPNMYTKGDWARGAWAGDTNADSSILGKGNDIGGDALVAGGGTLICAVNLKQSGKGRKVSYSEADFRISPDHISTMVNAEMLPLMHGISNTPF